MPPKNPLTPAQSAAVTFDGDALIVAAAGSGKTLVLVEKVAWAVEVRKIPLERIAVVTFTENAADELRTRIAKRLKLPKEDLTDAPIGTIHSLAARLLRLCGSAIGVSTDFQIMDESLAELERIRTIRETLIRLIEEREPTALSLIDEFGIHRSVGFVKDLIEARRTALPDYESLFKIVKKAYQERKKTLNRFDYNDLEDHLLRLLRHPDSLQKMRGAFAALCVDEFQDTSPVQWEILSTLHEKNRNQLVLVGDPRQSIYRFRGADPTLFERVRTQFETKGKLFFLNENFRSTSAVIDKVNQVAALLFERHYPPLISQDKTSAGEVEVLPLPETRGIDQRRATEASRVAERIKSLHEKGIPWGEIALLFRTRRAIPIFEQRFREAAIPFETSSGESLLEKKESISVLFLMRASVRPNDSIALFGLGQSPLASLAIEKFQELKEAAGPWIAKAKEEILPFYPDRIERTNVVLFLKLLEQLKELGGETVGHLVRDVESLRREGAVVKASSALGSSDAVQLLTFHAAKGLEFQVVLLCDLESPATRPPSLFVTNDEGGLLVKEKDRGSVGLKETLTKSRAFQQAEDKEREAALEEMKRLLYVGMTRAKERLILSLETGKKGARGPMARWLTDAFL